jgi:hypothetical protein
LASRSPTGIPLRIYSYLINLTADPPRTQREVQDHPDSQR